MTSLRLLAAVIATSAFAMPQDGKPAANATNAAAVDPAVKKALAALVGSVDMAKVFDQMPSWVAARAELDRKGAVLKAPIEQVRQQIEEQQATIKVLSPQAEERRDREFQVDLLTRQGQALAQHANQKMELEEARALLKAYQEIEIATDKVARARGVLFVLRMHDTGDGPVDPSKLPPGLLRERLAVQERRGVLWADEALDLTADVVKELMVPIADKKDAPKSPTDKPAAPAKTGG